MESIVELEADLPGRCFTVNRKMRGESDWVAGRNNEPPVDEAPAVVFDELPQRRSRPGG